MFLGSLGSLHSSHLKNVRPKSRVGSWLLRLLIPVTSSWSSGHNLKRSTIHRFHTESCNGLLHHGYDVRHSTRKIFLCFNCQTVLRFPATFISHLPLFEIHHANLCFVGSPLFLPSLLALFFFYEYILVFLLVSLRHDYESVVWSKVLMGTLGPY